VIAIGRQTQEAKTFGCLALLLPTALLYDSIKNLAPCINANPTNVGA
jgi:hypothetical protein